MPISDRLKTTAAALEEELQGLLAGPLCQGTPPRLLAAMGHALLGGGKRLRPFLVIESAALFGLPSHRAMSLAMAVELIHGYSLAHDDLPAMDDDKLRRGQPTVWAKFDEWTAILAGDAMQALAFEVLARENADRAPSVTVQLVAGLAAASGAHGMVGGQALDLEADKLGQPSDLDAGHIRDLQAMKTGALIRFSCESGAILAQADTKERRRLAEYGQHLGYAFQIADDLLDAQGDAEKVGKAVAKDEAAGKATLVSLMGIEAAKLELRATVERAQNAVKPFGDRAEALMAAADFVASRDR
ncbi:MAG: polyprenyl synthetase family protein [Alphaproteobacteria bacterium]|nr:polyprenyl synthetase family protein [Alphaproteobacteria bacterium]